MKPTPRLFSVLLAAGLAACAASNPPAPGAMPPEADAGAPDAAPPAPAADPTGWAKTGSLREARALATATVLLDGRVLVVGGEDEAYAMLASVEIFDPATNAFTAGAPLPAPRDHHTATLLESGEVLVAGGGQGSEISVPTGEKTLASALLYDPASDTWRATGSMHAARAGHRAARLADGRVLVAGGGDTIGYPCASIHPSCNIAVSLGSAEIYDPKTGAWTATGPLAQPRLAFDLRVAPAGVVASGGAAENKGLESVEVFDPASGTWHAGPKLKGQRLYHAAVVLGGKLVVAGGKIANVAPITSVDVLDERGASWGAGASLDGARTGASFLALQSGKGLIVAGDDQLADDPFLAKAALYDATSNAWTPIGALAEARYSQASVVLNDGSVLVLGGRTSSGTTRSAERSR